MTNSEYDERDKKHALNPVQGDYWSEMGSPACVVLQVVDNLVIYCRDTIGERIDNIGTGRWSWDLSKKLVKTKEEFNTWLKYKHNDRYWCSVSPEGHKWVRTYLGENDE